MPGGTRRIAGTAYWTLRNIQKRLEEGQQDLQAWREEQLEELKAYPDQVNWNTGAIYDPLVQIEDGKVINAKVIARIPREMLTAHRVKAAKLEEIAAELVEYREQLAKRLKTWPDTISLKDGTVDGEAYIATDPEAEAKPQEAKAPAGPVPVEL